MPKFRKIAGVYARREDGKLVTYRQGDVIDATEEELKEVDENLLTWERVEDDSPVSTDGGRTKENFLFAMRGNSSILHPDRLGVGQMLDLRKELYLRETNDVDDERQPIGELAKAKLQLEKALDAAAYARDVEPVSERTDGPLMSDEIARCQAVIALIEEEIAVLRKRLKPQLEQENKAAAITEERKRDQARKLAFHPAFRTNPVAQEERARIAAQKKAAEKTVKSVKKLRRATA